MGHALRHPGACAEVSVSGRKLELLAAAVVGAMICLPLFLRYLPMTDLPQHVAVAALLAQLGDPAAGVARYFEADPGRTLYLLPYGLAMALGQVLGPRAGMHFVVALASAAYLGGVALLLRARRQPWWLVLLALPFVFNRAFYWGFVNFSLGVGLALLAVGLLFAPTRSARTDVLAGLCALLSVFTHVYGVAMLLAFAAGWALFEPREVARRWRALVPAGVGAGLWLVLVQAAPGIEKLAPPRSPSLGERLTEFFEQVAGGVSDGSETPLLLAALGVTLVLSVRRGKEAEPAARPVLDRLLWAAVGLNLLLYLLLPEGTQSAGFVHFRHAVLGCALLPALARADAWPPARTWTLALAVGVAALLSSAVHLVGFDREARRFDAVLERVPPESKVIYLPLEPNGDWYQTAPYLHFGAYVQAARGGFVAQSFPQLFWNIPVKTKPGAVPPLMPGVEFAPARFDDAYFQGFFELVLVRVPGDEAIDRSPRFPFVLEWSQPPWRLYRRAP